MCRESKEIISIIIPVYNVEPYIEQCMESIIQQTYKYLEIIVIDDGSSDNCGKICDNYANRDGRIKVIHKKNAGLCAARNDGIREATGEWIAFVDSDDWCEKDYYERLICNAIDSDVDIVMAQGHIEDDVKRQCIKYNSKGKKTLSSRDDINMIIAQILAPQSGNDLGKSAASTGSPWDKLYRTDFIKRNNLLFDETGKAWEDLLFNYYAFSLAKKIKITEVIGYHYRQVKSSIMNGYNPNREKINRDFLYNLQIYQDEHLRSTLIQDAIYARTINMISNLFKTYYFHPKCIENKSVIRRKIKALKVDSMYHNAIYKKNKLLTKKQRVLVFLLRLPFIYPLKIVTILKEYQRW